MNAGRNILLPVDESKASESAFSWALENLVKDGDKVHLYKVLPRKKYVVLSTGLLTDEVPPVMEELVEDTEETMKHAEEQAARYVAAAYVPILETKQIPYEIDISRFAPDTDNVGSLICKKAEGLGATAIVMAKHRQGALREFFVGSVTSYCVHKSQVPVFVIHAD